MTTRRVVTVNFDGGSTGASAGYTVYNKATNDQPAVFTAITGPGSRDEYFAANPLELNNINNAPFAVGIGTVAEDPSQSNVDQWFAYIDGAWAQVVATLVGAQGAPGDAATVANLNANEVPMKSESAEELVASGLAFDPTTGRLISTKGLEVPPGTIYIGSNTAMSAAIRALNVRSDITGNTGLLLAQLYNATTGFDRPFAYTGDTIDTVDLNDPAGTDTADSAQFSMTTTEDELIIQVDIPTTNISMTDDFSVVIRTTSHTGPVAVTFDGQLTTDAQGVATLNLRTDYNPILVDDGTELFITFNCKNMLGVDDAGTFTPNITVHRIVIEREDLAFLSDVPGPPTAPQPSITSFSARGGSASVQPGTTLTGSVTFDFVVAMPGLVQGTLTLRQGSSVLANDISPTARSTTQTIIDVTLNAGDHVAFTLEGTSTTGHGFSRQFQVRAPQPAEIAYWGIRSSNDFDTVATSELTSVDVTANDSFDVTGALANGHTIGILMPDDLDLQRITTLGTPVTSSFTRSTDRTNFIVYTLTNSGGIDGQAAYTVEVR